jgi:hypothetical protein
MIARTARGRSAARRAASLIVAVTVSAASLASCAQSPVAPGDDPARPGASSFVWTVIPSTAGLNVQPGATGTFTIHLDSKENINSEVSFSLSGSVPANSTWTFAPQRLASTARDAELTVQTTSQTPFGSYLLTITASEIGYGTHDTFIRLDVVRAGTTPRFQLEINPGDITLTKGATATVAYSVIPLNGFAGTVDISVSGIEVPPAPVTVVTPPTPNRFIFASGDPNRSGIFVVGLAERPSYPTTWNLTVTATSGANSQNFGLLIRINAP